MIHTSKQLNENMTKMWNQFRKKNYFVGDLEWQKVLQDVVQSIRTYIIE